MAIPDRHVRTLTDAQCLTLLGRAETGRIAWCTARGPVVVPVSIRLAGHEVRIRTSAGSHLAERVDSERVAVQVDAIDTGTHYGWSVLVRGLAHVRVVAAAPDDPEPWPAGPHSALVTVDVDEVSGRWLDSDPTEPGPFPPG